MATSLKLLTSNTVTQLMRANLNNQLAQQAAEIALIESQDYFLTQLQAGITLTTSSRYPGSGTNTLTVPASPADLSGSSSMTGTYFSTINAINVDNYLISATVTINETTLTKQRVYTLIVDNSIFDYNLKITGQANQDDLGNNFSTFGDVNNDGMPDLLIGASFADINGNSSGDAYLILSRDKASWDSILNAQVQTSRELVLASEISDANAIVNFYGSAADVNAGESVTIGGDVNGDGISDLLISSPRGVTGGTSSGEVVLIMGRTNSEWASLTTDSAGNLELTQSNFNDANKTVFFYGSGNNEFLGRYALDCTGDVNADGYKDIAMGAIGGNADPGKLYVVLGRSTSDWASLTDANGDFDMGNATEANQIITFMGTKNGNDTGQTASIAGDVNNDGYDDILIGAPFGDEGSGSNAGEAYLVLGRSTSDWASLTDSNGVFDLSSASDANQVIHFIGDTAGDLMAQYAASIVSDVNNDGYDDVLIGVDNGDAGGSNSGEAFLFLGRSTSEWAALTDSSGDITLNAGSDTNRVFRFLGRNTNDFLMADNFRPDGSMAGIGGGDFDGDGFNDIVLSSAAASGGGSESGEAYVIFGRSLADWRSLTPGTDGIFNLDDMSIANRTIRIIGEASDDNLEATGVMADLDNNGYAELLLGATRNDTGGNNRGTVYMIYGRPYSEWLNLIDSNGDYNLDDL
ncbi:MAG: hypothetical protein AAGI66_04785 [Cyanobacteria bacterium P01_H01_bin.74]